MKKTIYFHIGFGKTGTTSIQKTLIANRDLLLTKKILYPKTGIIDGCHHGLALLGVRKFDYSLINLYSDLINEIESSEADKIIISSENFCFMNEEYINDLFKFFKNYSIEIIFYIRNQVDLIKSSFLQWVKVGGDPIYNSIDEFWDVHKNSFIFQNRLKPYFPHLEKENFKIHIYDKEIIANDVVQHFFNVTFSIDKNNIITVENFANGSLIEEFIEFANRINSLEKDVLLRQKSILSLVEASSSLKKYTKNALVTAQLKNKINDFYHNYNVDFVNEFLNQDDFDFVIDLIEE